MDAVERNRGIKGWGASMKTFIGLLVLAFVVALGITIGTKMSTEAMAVVVGIVCGVAASIPASVFMLMAITRRDLLRADGSQRHTARHDYPPITVSQGTPTQALGPGPQAQYWPVPPEGRSTQRQFHIVGEEDLFVGHGWRL